MRFLKLRSDATLDGVIRVYNDTAERLEKYIVSLERKIKDLKQQVEEVSSKESADE